MANIVQLPGLPDVTRKAEKTEFFVGLQKIVTILNLQIRTAEELDLEATAEGLLQARTYAEAELRALGLSLGLITGTEMLQGSEDDNG